MTTRRNLLVGAAAMAAPLALGAPLVLGAAPRPVPPPVRRLSTRPVVRTVTGAFTKDGAGVRLRRLLGSQELRMLDPFLLLDEFGSDDPADYLKGFPDHPHRGFETVTILMEGAVEHRDSVGNAGRLLPGCIQWMTAGRGIVHSEMPEPVDGRMRGFQLWVNLPAAHKWDPPRYQDLQAGDVPTVDLGDATARVLAGVAGGVKGPVDGVVVRPTVLDATVEEGGRLHFELPEGHTALVAGIAGAPRIGETTVAPGTLAVLGAVRVVEATGAGRLLLVAGAPIGEPVARGGPFVMNTEEEIRQAWADYRSGRLVGG